MNDVLRTTEHGTGYDKNGQTQTPADNYQKKHLASLPDAACKVPVISYAI